MDEQPKIAKAKVIKLGVSILMIVLIAIVLARYLINDDFRSMVDSKILRKNLSENSSNVIEINSDSNPYVYAFDKYITVLSKNVLSFYAQDAKFVSSIDINITTPYINSEDKYLVVAEKGGNKLYFISEMGIKWEKDIEGEIYRVSVNKNGYVSVILKNATYKSIAVVFDVNGNELLRNFLKSSYAICSEISDNNQYLAIGRVDYSGTVVKSIIDLISIGTVKDNPKNSVVNKYESESGKILANIKFNDKDEAICMFDSYIQKLTKNTSQKIYDISSDNMFVDINLKNNLVIVEKETSGLFSYEYQMSIKNTAGKSDNLYILGTDTPKKLKVTENLICLNLANEVRVVSSGGWLLKCYTTKSEIQDIVVGDSIIGIIYNNKIEVIGI